MSDLIRHLRSFNKKERFILLQEALGADTFSLDNDFRKRLGNLLEFPIPAEAFVAMDYHFDWIQMALYLAATPAPPSPIPNDELFKANQEDVDLLVAFDGSAMTHLVLVEAKMETGWTNSQLRSKAQRLRRIFDAGQTGADFVTPHFVLASPKQSERVCTDTWPQWMAPNGVALWMELPRPTGLREVTRCTEDGRVSASGGFLRIDS